MTAADELQPLICHITAKFLLKKYFLLRENFAKYMLINWMEVDGKLSIGMNASARKCFYDLDM